MSTDHLREHPKHRPIRFAAGSLGQGLPNRDLVVSPQHRMLISSDVAERMFGDREILVPACQLVGLDGIARVETDQPAHYVHILLDHHAVVFAEGAPSETLFLGDRVHENLSSREISIIQSKLPENKVISMRPARQMVRGQRLKWLLERHVVNNKPLLDQRFDQTETLKSKLA